MIVLEDRQVCYTLVTGLSSVDFEKDNIDTFCPGIHVSNDEEYCYKCRYLNVNNIVKGVSNV